MQKKNMQIPPSELILNADGSIYHLNLHPEQIADTVFTVGDPDRVEMVSQHFDRITDKVQKREFFTHTGELNGKRITVISTGIGTDNVDIVLNEIDALVNIDFEKRQIKEKHRKLKFIRLGTSGAMQPDIPVDSTLISQGAVGIDTLLSFYDFKNTDKESAFLTALQSHLNSLGSRLSLYYFDSTQALQDQFRSLPGVFYGTTVTCPGFYGPQGRILRLPLAIKDLNEQLMKFRFEGRRLDNFEMESSSIFGLSSMLGHDSLAINTILANRPGNLFSKDPKSSVKKMISKVMEIISDSSYFS